LNPIDASWIERVAKKVVPKVLRFYRVDPETKLHIIFGQLEHRSAEVSRRSWYLHGQIVFDPSAEWADKDEVYGAIVHEACHVVSDKLYDAAYLAVEQLSEPPREYALENIRRANEELTERLARVYVGLHPLKEVVI
jgi:hypothetical protein